ncbi:MAG: tetratricopeptide repeat protein [bacterium]|nr:tetratricopeptide repeat protein [bacterium]
MTLVRIVAGTAFLVVAAALAQAAQEERLDAEALYARGLNALTAGDFEVAAQSFQEFATRYANEPAMTAVMPRVYYALGCAWYNLRKMEKAVEAFEEHLRRAPTSPQRAEVVFRMASAQQALGDYGRAVKLYNELLRGFPEFEQGPDARFQMAVCYMAMEDYTNAIPALLWVRSHPRARELAGAAEALLIRCYLQRGMYQVALSNLVRVVRGRLAEDHVVLLGLAALQLGDYLYEDYNYEGALDAYRCVMRRGEMERRQRVRVARLQRLRSAVEKQSNQTWERVSMRERLAGLEAQCQAELEQLAGMPEFDTAWLMRLARCFYDVGRLWEACIAFRAVVEEYPQSGMVTTAHARLVLCLAQMRLFPTARAEAEAFLMRYPRAAEAPQIAFVKAESYLNEENFAAAEAELVKLLEEYPEHPSRDRAEFYLHLAQALQEKFTEARAGLERWRQTAAYAKSSAAVDVAYWYAMVLYFSGDYTNALAQLTAFLQQHPESIYAPDVLYRIGAAHYLLERYRDAAITLVQFTQRYPDHPLIWEARMLRGDALAALGQLDIAIRAYQELRPESGPYYHYGVAQIGKCYKSLQNYTNMVVLYQEYVATVPNSPQVVEGMYWLGWAYRQLGNLHAAREAYWDALARYGNQRAWWGFEEILKDLQRMYPGSNGVEELAQRLREEVSVQRARGRLTLASRLAMAEYYMLQRNGRTNEAEELARTFGARYPTNVLGADGLLFVARQAWQQGRTADAVPLFMQISREFAASPLRAEAELRLAQVARQRGALEEAARHLAAAEAAVQDVPTALEITIERAEHLLGVGEARAAIAKFEEVLANRAARGPLWPRALFGIASAYEELTDYVKAIPYYQRIYVMYAGYPELTAKAYYYSGRCFERLNKIQEAINSYRELLNDPRLEQYEEARYARERLKHLTGSNVLQTGEGSS